MKPSPPDIKRRERLASALLLGMILLLSAPNFALSQAQGPFHPMDALTAHEINQAVQILRKGGIADKTTSFADVRLIEIAKPQMLAWRKGMKIKRKALAILRKSGKTLEAVIDLNTSKIISVTAKPGAQTSIIQAEFDKARRLTKADRRWQAAMRKRGFKSFKTISCAPVAAGYFGIAKYRGKRLLKVPCYVLQKPTKNKLENLYRAFGIPIEGVHAVVDVDAGTVLDVMDSGIVPMKAIATKPSASITAAPRAPLKPVYMSSPQGLNFKITGGLMVEWQNWSFHVRAERRLGPIISLVHYQDGAAKRLIAYQMALSEMFVPYMDKDPNWIYRGYLDAGEYGIGYLASPLVPGRDCPQQSAYISTFMPADQGGVFQVPRALCIFERSTGDPLWRHEDIGTRRTEARPGVELVVRMATIIGNYDYLIDFVFSQDGNIKGRIGASGLLAVKGSKRTKAQSLAWKLKNPKKHGFGTLVSPNMLAVYHDHYFSFRLDIDVDGQANTLIRERLVPTRLKNNIRRSLWRLEPYAVTKEGPVRMMMGTPEIFRIVNPNKKTKLGHAPSIHLMPGMSATSLLAPDDFPQKRAAFSAEKLWITAFKPHEKHAAGSYPNQHKGNAGLPAYSADKQSVENRDIVLWYTIGFHHITRVEDWPVMPTMWHEFTLRPFNFFAENPAVNVAPDFKQPQPKAPKNKKEPKAQP